ncbi:unnamed protein product [Closterium sp. NIES-65]|nr:unnamed protein product [Closterium sp. NIES-65]
MFQWALFAHFLATDAMPCPLLSYIRLTEEDTLSSSRIFFKIMFQVGFRTSRRALHSGALQNKQACTAVRWASEQAGVHCSQVGFRTSRRALHSGGLQNKQACTALRCASEQAGVHCTQVGFRTSRRALHSGALQNKQACTAVRWASEQAGVHCTQVGFRTSRRALHSGGLQNKQACTALRCASEQAGVHCGFRTSKRALHSGGLQNKQACTALRCTSEQAGVHCSQVGFRTSRRALHSGGLQNKQACTALRLFAHFLATDAMPWALFSYIRLTEEDTSSSSRIFIKIMFQEMWEQLGLHRMKERLSDLSSTSLFPHVPRTPHPHSLSVPLPPPLPPQPEQEMSDQLGLRKMNETLSNVCFEMSEQLGLRKMNERLSDPTMGAAFDGIFPKDTPKNTRFAINFFTSIGLGGLTDNLREHLKNMPKLIMQQQKPVQQLASGGDAANSECAWRCVQVKRHFVLIKYRQVQGLLDQNPLLIHEIKANHEARQLSWLLCRPTYDVVQGLLDQNRLLIHEIKANHEARLPDGLMRNVTLIRELNSNVTKVVDIRPPPMYADISHSFPRTFGVSTAAPHECFLTYHFPARSTCCSAFSLRAPSAGGRSLRSHLPHIHAHLWQLFCALTYPSVVDLYADIPRTFVRTLGSSAASRYVRSLTDPFPLPRVVPPTHPLCLLCPVCVHPPQVVDLYAHISSTFVRTFGSITAPHVLSLTASFPLSPLCPTALILRPPPSPPPSSPPPPLSPVPLLQVVDLYADISRTFVRTFGSSAATRASPGAAGGDAAAAGAVGGDIRPSAAAVDAGGAAGGSSDVRRLAGPVDVLATRTFMSSAATCQSAVALAGGVQYVLLTLSLPSPPSFELAAKPDPPSSPSSLSRPHSPRSHNANAANPKGGDGGSGGGRWQGDGEGLLRQHDVSEKFGPKGANAANPSAGGRPPAGGKGKGGGAAAEGGDEFDYHMGLSTRPPWYCRAYRMACMRLVLSLGEGEGEKWGSRRDGAVDTSPGIAAFASLCIVSATSKGHWRITLRETYASLCKVNATSKETLESHSEGKKHRGKVRGATRAAVEATKGQDDASRAAEDAGNGAVADSAVQSGADGAASGKANGAPAVAANGAVTGGQENGAATSGQENGQEEAKSGGEEEGEGGAECGATCAQGSECSVERHVLKVVSAVWSDMLLPVANGWKGGEVQRCRGAEVEWRGGEVQRWRGGVERWRGAEVERWSGEVHKCRGGEVERRRGGEVERRRGGEVERRRGGEVARWGGGEVASHELPLKALRKQVLAAAKRVLAEQSSKESAKDSCKQGAGKGTESSSKGRESSSKGRESCSKEELLAAFQRSVSSLLSRSLYLPLDLSILTLPPSLHTLSHALDLSTCIFQPSWPLHSLSHPLDLSIQSPPLDLSTLTLLPFFTSPHPFSLSRLTSPLILPLPPLDLFTRMLPCFLSLDLSTLILPLDLSTLNLISLDLSTLNLISLDLSTLNLISLDLSALILYLAAGEVQGSPVAPPSGHVTAPIGPVPAPRGHVAALRSPVAAPSGLVAALRGPVAASSGPVAALRGPVAASRGPVAASTGPVAASTGPVAASTVPFIAEPPTAEQPSHQAVEPPSCPAAGKPSSRAAQQPSRPAAEPPSSRAAQQPSR